MLDRRRSYGFFMLGVLARCTATTVAFILLVVIVYHGDEKPSCADTAFSRRDVIFIQRRGLRISDNSRQKEG